MFFIFETQDSSTEVADAMYSINTQSPNQVCWMTNYEETGNLGREQHQK